MSRTLDQQRGAFAWECAQAGIAHKEYKNLAKGAPALIMNSGLMPTLAFDASKGEAHRLLLEQIYQWFNRRFAERDSYLPLATGFQAIMTKLHGGGSAFYLEANDEAQEIIKWIRQFVDAVDTGRT